MDGLGSNRRAGRRGWSLGLVSSTLALVALAAVSAPSARAAPLGEPPPPSLPLNFELVPLPVQGVQSAGFCFLPDGRALWLEKPGLVRVVNGNAFQSPNFLDLRAEVNNDHDRGLLSVALHPGWVPDGGPQSWVYFAYTVTPVFGQDFSYSANGPFGHSRLTRYRALQQGGALRAVLATREVLLGLEAPDGSVPLGPASLHNSHSNGSLVFGTDGTLLYFTGDGAHYEIFDIGGADDPGFDDQIHPATLKPGPTPKEQDCGVLRAQDLRSLSGKVLRLDPETGMGLPSNPFYDGDPNSVASRVFALGVRNPFRAHLLPGSGALDPALANPGSVFFGDVGWNTWEELNLVRGGENFGWPCSEGFLPQEFYANAGPNPQGGADCTTLNAGVLQQPQAAWSHLVGGALYPFGIHFTVDGKPANGFTGNCVVAGPTYVGNNYPPEYFGRMFVADYSSRWLRTVTFGPHSSVVAIHDFGSEVGFIVDMHTHPISGDVYVMTHKFDENRLWHLRYTPNLSPIAAASATPTSGAAPLVVQFDASDSSDPEGQPLDFSWDFDDGSPPGTGALVVHQYDAPGDYTARVTVTDPLGAHAALDLPLVVVGNTPPQVQILAPAHGQLFAPLESIALQGTGSDAQDPNVTLTWSVAVFHDDHSHPSTQIAQGPNASFVPPRNDHGAALAYYRIELRATDQQGLSSTARVYVYPEGNLFDRSGTALPRARALQISPGGPQGIGNKDIEVVRDAVEPPAASLDPNAQFDTFLSGAQGNDDWIGYELAAAPSAMHRFVGLDFREGLHAEDGGWFKSLQVEVLRTGVWSAVQNLHIDPPYPFGLANQPGFDGIGFQRYELRFDPIWGEGVRLRGVPGGSEGYVSCAELRALAIDAPPAPSPLSDISEQGTIVARVFELTPPVPLGNGNLNPETLRNGTQPAPGSTSAWAQFDTAHEGDQGNDDWIGYTFDGLRSLVGIDLQEGLNSSSGGGFDTLAVERLDSSNQWLPISAASFDPPHAPVVVGTHYETTRIRFPAVLARGLRLRGKPSGTTKYVSAAELRVFEPGLPAGCGWSVYGFQPGGQQLALSSATPAAIGLPVALTVSGASGAGVGLMGFSPAAASLPIFGQTLLLDPAGLLTFGLAFGPAGNASFVTAVPNQPGLAGLQIHAQAAFAGLAFPSSLRLSNGLRLDLCRY
jgi:glucose/arabinose dehydrogenase